ncbi:hypothetical protein [Anabaena catenula]|uniref:hypothetical protein n=1 Tax=Anabaena catenula TaxID=1296320 RepID=UPI0018F02492|nr:hypothetical protein [Anabaena catenula]
MPLHKQNPSKGYDALALNISERSHARGLVELLTKANIENKPTSENWLEELIGSISD